ncbi:MAG: ABC transporter ATP-binding protein [Anaerolineales bacterium]|nr:ABC transporter ATP-binding protein [Anaerolineales bacterium]
MSNTVISVEDVSKSYQLGVIGTGSFRGDLQRWWAKQRGLPDPHLKIGEKDHGNRDGETVWALKDVSFTVRQGEALGIIGRNGAGKSTLLKILSQVTAPTSGVVKVKGRIASLLEVGTGFHPELTGRENIYLNGAILGMSRQEIRRKFDEIVDFSGVETYIDTPVKRYSSGMYVRLAFAVAAHLESDILVVDEVLAVGDAEFQKKCLGKMSDVTGEGRTVLFVSHNMLAIQGLCKDAIWIDKGEIVQSGSSASVIAAYLNKHSQVCLSQTWDDLSTAPGNETGRLVYAAIETDPGHDIKHLTVDSPIRIKFRLMNYRADVPLHFGFELYSQDRICVFINASPRTLYPRSIVEAICNIPGNILNDSNYYINLMIHYDAKVRGFRVDNLLCFDVHDVERDGWYGKWNGVIRPSFDWQITPIIPQE